VKITVQDEQLELLAERAIYWSRMNALIITDPHFGKSATFRNAGIPVPEDTTAADLKRLTQLIAQTSATSLIVLGDLLHAKAGRKNAVVSAVDEWRGQHPGLTIQLLRGNHDRAAGAPPESWHIEVHAHDLFLDPFTFTHEPPKLPDDRYVMCGHIHPAVSLSDGLHKSVRLPCFSFGECVAILPAFGSFTGTYEIEPAANDRIFVIAGNEVIEVPHARNG